MMRTIATRSYPPTPPPTPTPPASPQPLDVLRESQRRALDQYMLRDEPAPKPVPLPPGAPAPRYVPTGILGMARYMLGLAALDAEDADSGCVL